MKRYLCYLFTALTITMTSGRSTSCIARHDARCRPLVQGSDRSNKLYQYLMSNYNKNVRPVRNNSDLVTVKLGLKLIQIADVVRIACRRARPRPFVYTHHLIELLQAGEAIISIDVIHLFPHISGWNVNTASRTSTAIGEKRSGQRLLAAR